MGLVHPRSGCRCPEQLLPYGSERHAYANRCKRATESASTQCTTAKPADQCIRAERVHGGKRALAACFVDASPDVIQADPKTSNGEGYTLGFRMNIKSE